MYIFICIYIYIYILIYWFLYLYIFIYLCTCTYFYIYVFIFIYMYIYIYIYYTFIYYLMISFWFLILGGSFFTTFCYYCIMSSGASVRSAEAREHSLMASWFSAWAYPPQDARDDCGLRVQWDRAARKHRGSGACARLRRSMVFIHTRRPKDQFPG